MAGFTVIISNQQNPSIDQLDLSGCESIQNIFTSDYELILHTNNKFTKDCILVEDVNYAVGVDGVIYNLSELLSANHVTDLLTLIVKLYKEFHDRFPKQLKGEFVGFIFDKHQGKWNFFTNQTGTRRFYYYHHKNNLIVSSELKHITSILKNQKTPYSVDPFGMYCMLTYGYMLEDYTYIKEIKRLKPGRLLLKLDEKVEITTYHEFNYKSLNTDPSDCIDRLDMLFNNALKLTFNKDLEYGYSHFASLSGGLDSRMMVMISHKLGYPTKQLFTLSQSNYYDEKIAKRIASDLRNEFILYTLDNGIYLKNSSEFVKQNSGLVYFSGAAHFRTFLEKINFNKFGLIHSGLLGDAILGTYLYDKGHTPPKMAMESNYTHEIQQIKSLYETNELFLLYNRGFNGITNGAWTSEDFSYMSSPFMDVDFMDFALNISPKLKYKEKIYVQWILKKHPDVANYQWEKIGFKPTNNLLLRKLGVVNRRMRRNFFVKGSSMNPFEYWKKMNPELFNLNPNDHPKALAIIEKHPDINKSINGIVDTPLNQMKILTMLKALELHF